MHANKVCISSIVINYVYLYPYLRAFKYQLTLQEFQDEVDTKFC